ncbi:MAG: hypothetical protein CR993_09760 [Rhodobacterales bacterium]|nr:MAG: hypothetical protein CR993_09760 [Rhodobacterales bacterium]
MDNLLTFLPFLAVLLGIGAFAGVLAGLLGVGGGIVLVPAFYYSFSAMGYASDGLMQICVATSLATIIVTSARSVAAHNRRDAVDWPVLRSFAPGIVVGAGVGVFLAAGLSSTTLMAVFSVMGVAIGMYMVFGRSDFRLRDTLPGPAVRAGYGAGIGFISSLMGIGGGAFAVPILTLHGVPIHRAVATAAGVGATIALPSVIGFMLVKQEVAPPFTIGSVNLPAFLIIISMTLLTTPLGARLSHALDPKPLKRAFGLFLAIVALNMARKVLMGG